MKKILFLAAALLTMAACNNKSAEQQRAGQEENVEAHASEVPVYKLDSLLKVADRMVDQTVTVRGFVTHTCKHSGKRCFIVGDDPNTSFRVEAGGEIGGFNRELTGSEYIDQYEEEVNEKKHKEDGSAETCQAELNNINEMREWMKAHNKDYYSIYYMDGERYEVIE